MNFILVRNKDEYIKFINDIKDEFDCVEDWQYYFGFELKYDEDGLPLETIFEYHGEIKYCPDSFPAIIYCSFNNERDRFGKFEIRIIDYATFEELGIET